MTSYLRCIQSFVERAIDQVFPPSDDQMLVRELIDQKVRMLLAPETEAGIVSLFRFRHRSVRALIHEAKFHGNESAFLLLGGAFAHYWNDFGSNDLACIVPIPLSRPRHRERGYNQVAEVLRRARRTAPSLIIHEGVLERVRNTRPQTELSREDRLTNVARAFSVKLPSVVAGNNIILVDDVSTTGATMRAAKAALLPHAPASVTMIVLAH